MFDGILEPGEINELITGIEGQVVPLVERMPGAQIYETRRQSGDQAILPVISSTGRARDEGLAPGEAAEDIKWGVDRHPFEIKRYVGYTTITDDDEEDLLDDGINAATQMLTRARMDSVAKQDARLNVVLTSTVINEEQPVANNDWGDEDSTPWIDLVNARRKSSYGDIGVFGPKIIDLLKVHPDTTAKFGNYPGAAIGDAELAAELAKVLGLRAVLTGNYFYNAASPGLSAVIAYQFDNVAWIGHAKSFIVVNKRTKMPSESARDLRREGSAIRYTQRRSISRAYKFCGAIITGAVPS